MLNAPLLFAINHFSLVTRQMRLQEAKLSEEPGARKPHAGICVGGVG